MMRGACRLGRVESSFPDHIQDRTSLRSRFFHRCLSTVHSKCLNPTTSPTHRCISMLLQAYLLPANHRSRDVLVRHPLMVPPRGYITRYLTRRAVRYGAVRYGAVRSSHRRAAIATVDDPLFFFLFLHDRSMSLGAFTPYKTKLLSLAIEFFSSFLGFFFCFGGTRARRVGFCVYICVGCKEVGTCGRLCVSRCGVPNVLEEQQPSTSWGWPLLFPGGGTC
jgi:hypothetical protein